MKAILPLINFSITKAKRGFAPDKNFDCEGKTRFTPDKNFDYEGKRQFVPDKILRFDQRKPSSSGQPFSGGLDVLS